MDTPSTPTPTPTPASTGEAGNEWIVIRQSDIHGTGAFARTHIPAETCLIEYLGERVDKEESGRRCEEGNPFIFFINDEWDIDGDVPWNPARFFNHSCDPNCEARQDDDHIWIWSTREIPPGTELTYNYGYDLSEWRDYECACGAPQCVGYIVAEEHQDQVRRQLEIEAAAKVRS